mmetsp:Transcript_52955/g.80291  ORF Transcript_52955/g.80291 Transcript_52955/m.80291 type:complete len:88 (-) Transcript_52955:64-327(-)
MTIVTLYALFGDDIRVLATNKDGDAVFYGLACASLVLFSIEIILACYAKAGYLFGFFFWLDIISTVSIIFDIGWIMDAILGTSGDAA